MSITNSKKQLVRKTGEKYQRVSPPSISFLVDCGLIMTA